MVNKNDISDLAKFFIAFIFAMVVFGVLVVFAYNWEGKNILDYLDASISNYLEDQWHIK